MSHTPGPWNISKIGNDYDQYLIYAPGQQSNIVKSCNGKANACLIAAAPDLLAAAKGLLNGAGHLPECERVYCKIACQAIREAIAKAEGRS